MRRSRLPLIVALAMTSSAAVVAAPGTASAAPDDTSVQILTMNDFHGRISPQSGGDGQLLTTGVGPGPDGKTGTSDDGTELVGGAAYIAATVQQQKAAFSTDPAAASFFVGAGDLVSASPFNSSVFKDEPTIEVLNAMGLDVSSVGNHEFDRGQQELRRISAATDDYEAAHGGTVAACDGVTAGQDGCFGEGAHAFEGADFPYLAANVVQGTTIADAPILPPYQLLDVGDGKRIALIGVVTKDTPNIVSPEGIQGLTFLDEATTINHYADLLTDPSFDGGHPVSAIGVLIHEGGTVKSAPASYEGCAGQLAGSPIAAINGTVESAVDFIVSAHTHVPYDCTLQDPSGAPRLVTQAGFYGKVVTDIRLHLDASGDVVRSTAAATNVPVRREGVTPDATVKSVVDYWEGRSAVAGSVPVGSQLGDLDRAYRGTAPVRDSESNLGNLIADAQLAAWPDADVAFMNPGGIRADINCASTGASDPAGNINYAETFTAQPFSNTVNTVQLSGKGIHDALEQQWRTNKDGGIDFLQLSVAGLTYTFDPNAPLNDRVDPATIQVGGTTLDLAATYDVVANSFLVDGGDSFSAFTAERRGDKVDVTGPNDVDVLNDYLDGSSPVTPPALDRAVSLDPAKTFDDDGSGRAPCNPQAATASIDQAKPTRGQQVTVSGTLFEPRESITATLADGRVVGTAAADDTGSVTISFRVPADLKAGQQTVTLTGASGEQATTTFTLGTVGSDVKAVITAIITKLLAWLRGR